MFQKILVALDGSAAAKRALQTALDLAQLSRAEIHALGVEEHLPHYVATVGEFEEEKEEQDSVFAKVMSEARAISGEQGFTLETRIQAGNAAHCIIEAARDGGFDLVVLGAKGHSVIRDFLLGTTTDRVSHHAPCSVLIVR
jgi:nucleotide-binding universal stress UspA family protein